MTEMEKKKGAKMKSLIAKALGINQDWKLNADGQLDVSAEERERIVAEYGADFLSKFEKLLSGDSAETENSKHQSKIDMSKQVKLALVCAMLSTESLEASEDGSVTLNQDQLNAIEAGLKKLEDENRTAVSDLASANTAKAAADKSLADAITALDQLDDTVKGATDITGKIEAVRAVLAKKPGAPASGVQSESDTQKIVIEGADEITEYAKTFL